MSDELRERFLAVEWGRTLSCTACPDGHPVCLQCGGTKPGSVCAGKTIILFGHQRYIQGGDYDEDCVYTSVDDSMAWTLEDLEREADSQRKKETCRQEGHIKGEESIGTMHSRTVAITPQYECLRCGVAYKGKKRKVSKP